MSAATLLNGPPDPSGGFFILNDALSKPYEHFMDLLFESYARFRLIIL